ncbi:MAG: hypothetical protein AAGG50_03765 [Bacteroidota bacterium]
MTDLLLAVLTIGELSTIGELFTWALVVAAVVAVAVAALAALYGRRNRVTIPAGRHSTLAAWLTAWGRDPLRGNLYAEVVIHSDPREVEADLSDVAVGDLSKLLGRTLGLRFPRRGSIRLGCRAERERLPDGSGGGPTWGAMTGMWEVAVLTHDPKQRGTMGFGWLGFVVAPGERFSVSIVRHPSVGREGTSGTRVTVADPDRHTSVSRSVDVPVAWRWGFALPVWFGGNDPASAPLEVEIRGM